jgi:uncharacterized membrane protein YphA (DoxX/SURF4 family)
MPRSNVGVTNEFSSAIRVVRFSRFHVNRVSAEWFGIINRAVAAEELIEHGAPASVAPLLMVIARTIEIFAGFSLAFGVYPRLAAVAMLAFLFPATLTAHGFWQVAGTAAFTPQLLNFFKNVAMMGGLLFIVFFCVLSAACVAERERENASLVVLEQTFKS